MVNISLGFYLLWFGFFMEKEGMLSGSATVFLQCFPTITKSICWFSSSTVVLFDVLAYPIFLIFLV